MVHFLVLPVLTGAATNRLWASGGNVTGNVGHHACPMRHPWAGKYRAATFFSWPRHESLYFLGRITRLNHFVDFLFTL